MSDQPFGPHLEPGEIAAYLDRAVSGEVRARIESHFAECADCREDLMAASSIVTSLRRRTTAPRVWVSAAAVAAVILFVAWPRVQREQQVAMREAPVTTTVAPRTLSPVGTVNQASALTWSSVPLAERYRVRIFDGDGSVTWERETTDTTVSIPNAVSLRPGRTYSWKVEAYAGFGRSTASELTQFTVGNRPRP